MAERASEAAALDVRVAQAEASARALSYMPELAAFGAAVSKSQAVVNRSLGALSGWVNGANPMFLSYYRQVEQGRQPDGTEWDEQRSAAEAAINPYCYQDLNYAALTLDGQGMSYYGAYSVILRDITIEDRASVFEENPFYFNPRHHVIAGSSPPAGFRAPWAGRGRLAIAKLGRKIKPDTGPNDFAAVLMEPRRSESDCDFIEVHIYGPVNRAGVEVVKGPRPSRAADRALWNQTTRSLAKLGVRVEEVS